jgi:hypothetical protein
MVTVAAQCQKFFRDDPLPRRRAALRHPDWCAVEQREYGGRGWRKGFELGCATVACRTSSPLSRDREDAVEVLAARAVMPPIRIALGPVRRTAHPWWPFVPRHIAVGQPPLVCRDRESREWPWIERKGFAGLVMSP